MNSKQKQVIKAYLRRRQSDASVEGSSSGMKIGGVVGGIILILILFFIIQEYLWRRFVEFIFGKDQK
jgi:hypothetical protein